MNYIKYAIITLLIISLSGCAFIKKSSKYSNRDDAYLNAKTIPPLRIPPGTTSNGIESYYPVSEKQYPEDLKAVSLVPPGLNKPKS